MANIIQSSFNAFQSKGFIGTKVRPDAPFEFDLGVAGEELKPGEGVLYDKATNKFLKPTNAAERLLVTGIVSLDPGVVATATTVPAGGNSDAEVKFAIDTVIKVMIRGSIFVIAGADLEYGDQLVFDEATSDWIIAPALTADATTLPKSSIVCIERKPVLDGALIEVRHNGVVR